MSLIPVCEELTDQALTAAAAAAAAVAAAAPATADYCLFPFQRLSQLTMVSGSVTSLSSPSQIKAVWRLGSASVEAGADSEPPPPPPLPPPLCRTTL